MKLASVTVTVIARALLARLLPTVTVFARALLVSLLLTVTAFAQPAIIVSPSDDKSYRALTLSNNLKVVLVSDPAADKAAASLDVHVGNGSDPPQWNGLAHFLEHMLFLGTEKYPQAGAYKKFIDEHGGDHNAYTSFAHTNYYFDIGAEYLKPALDRFSRFFIDPTFDATFVDRERAVVHSEYQSKLKDDGRRAWSARRQLVNPNHPGARFAVGSQHTLRDRPHITARAKLMEFYRQHYSANIMTLAVVGKEPLDELERWVTELFSAVPDRDVTVEIFTQPYLTPALRASQLNIAPQQDQLRVSFLFPIPPTQEKYRAKPLHYVANLIGHEGDGSLLALLESLGWADALSAGAGYMDKAQGVFEVSVQLTETGLARIDDIGALLFAYINLIERDGISEWRFDEERQLADIAFRFSEDAGGAATARQLAVAQHLFPTEELLRGAFVMDDYRRDWIAALLKSLRPDNVYVQVIAKGVATDRETPFYETEYGIQPIAPATLARWRDAANLNDARLALPVANPYIPERLTVKSQRKKHAPKLLTSFFKRSRGIQLWYHPDREFNTPRAAFYFSVQSPAAGRDARAAVLGELFVRLVRRQLETETYPALLAGVRYQLYQHGRGFSVRVSGYEDKQPVLLAEILSALATTQWDARAVTLIKDELRRELKNIALQTPSNQTAHEVYRLLLEPYWDESARLAVLDDVMPDDLRAYHREFFANMHITALAHGDVTRKRARAMCKQLRTAFKDSDLLDEVARNRVRQLDAEIYLRTMHIDHNDSALAIYFQGRDKSVAERARMLLLTKLVESPFFFNLRTTNRVGYVVHALNFSILEVPALLLSVQSPTHPPAAINQLVDAFLTAFAEQLTVMSPEEFARVKRGLIDRLSTRDNRLADRTNRHWREIDRRQFSFDTRQRLADAVTVISQDEMVEYFDQTVLNSPRKLIIQSRGRRVGDGDDDRDSNSDSNSDGDIANSRYITVPNTVQFRNAVQSFFPRH